MPPGFKPVRHQTGAKTSAGMAKRSSPTAAGSSPWPTACRVATIQPAQIATAPRAAATPVAVPERRKVEGADGVQSADMAASCLDGRNIAPEVGACPCEVWLELSRIWLIMPPYPD